MTGKATPGIKRMELLHDKMEGRDYGQLKDLISDTASEKTCQKSAGNSGRLKKKKEQEIIFRAICCLYAL